MQGVESQVVWVLDQVVNIGTTNRLTNPIPKISSWEQAADQFRRQHIKTESMDQSNIIVK